MKLRRLGETGLRVAIAVAAALGLAITAYLLYERWTGGALACSTGGCKTVQHSAYSETFGVPVAALGFLAFAGLLATAVARGSTARLAQATLAITAVVFSGYLLYLQIGVIHAVCQWCVASDVLTTVIAGLALLRLATLPATCGPEPPSRPAVRHPKRRQGSGSRTRTTARRPPAPKSAKRQ
jgi:uncharacterized membrane protein